MENYEVGAPQSANSDAQIDMCDEDNRISQVEVVNVNSELHFAHMI